MESLVHRRDPLHRYIIRQITIAAQQPSARAAHGGAVEMHYLGFGMHTGIRAPAGSDPDRLVCHQAQSPFQLILDVAGMSLALPAMVGRPVIFDSRCPAHATLRSGLIWPAAAR